MDDSNVAETLALLEELADGGQAAEITVPHVEDVILILKTADRIAELVDEILVLGDPSGFAADAISRAVASIRGRGRAN